jgi:cephalosporin hydroxylase
MGLAIFADDLLNDHHQKMEDAWEFLRNNPNQAVLDFLRNRAEMELP